MFESKLFEELFLFCSCLDIFSERVRVPYSKLLEELLSVTLVVFQEGGGGLPDYKKFEELFIFAWTFFSKGGGVT